MAQQSLLKGYCVYKVPDNLTDEDVLARAGTRPILDFPVGTLRPPRTYGVRVGFDF